MILLCFKNITLVIPLQMNVWMDIQWRADQTAHSHISLCKWGHFERAKTTLKMLLASWFLVCFFKRLRSLLDTNLESVDQRAAKLPAIKLWEWLERARHRTRADCFEWGRMAYIFPRPRKVSPRDGTEVKTCFICHEKVSFSAVLEKKDSCLTERSSCLTDRTRAKRG